MLSRDSEIVICSICLWTVYCDLVIWTQPSGPLCLWQCFIIVPKAVDPRPPTLCFENLGCKVCLTDFVKSAEASAAPKIDKIWRRSLENMSNYGVFLKWVRPPPLLPPFEQFNFGGRRLPLLGKIWTSIVFVFSPFTISLQNWRFIETRVQSKGHFCFKLLKKFWLRIILYLLIKVNIKLAM